MNNRKIDRDLLIKAIIARDKQGIILLTGDTDSQIHQFYTADLNVNLSLKEDIEYNDYGDYYDAKGAKISYREFKEFETKNRERTAKLGILPDLICLQLIEHETLSERIKKLKENGKTAN